MLQVQNSNVLNQLLKLLEDGKWHSSQELAVKASQRFGHTIYEARKKGFNIECRRGENQRFEYRLLSKCQSHNEQSSLQNSLKEKLPHLELLILFGSRAREDSHSKSDWDFAVLYNQPLENDSYLRYEIYDILSEYFGIPDTKIDVVELNNASPLIAHHVARDGKIVYEEKKGLFEEFCQKSLLNSQQLRDMRQTWQNEIESFLREQGV